ncbi:hypothetical protein [Nocardia sp. alder85J]|uniref:hypothetical protein n=1 Tax=Nocardia sp. alder85J TaxID=2862949 RepID=UPI001CD2535D|nr:hypothetical protein [Nocardia sp. alder85J]MCX4097753.1 hypothetical protein [Nocardia sp. alder85J]
MAAQSDPSSAVDTALDWGAQLRGFRRRQGMTQRRFATELKAAGHRLGVDLACDQQHISLWECGRVEKITPGYLAALREIGAPLPAAAPPALSADAVDSAGFVAALAGVTVGAPADLDPWLPDLTAGSMPLPGNVGAADVEFVRVITANLRGMDQRHGGFAVADRAADWLNWGRRLLDRCDNPATGMALAGALADLSRVAGWAHHDIGDQSHARSYLALALKFAHDAGVPSLAASVLYALGRVALAQQRPQAALQIFQLGQISAQDAADSAESARLHANEAWAHAMMGRETGMLDALARADHELARAASTETEPAPWTQVYFAAGEQAGLAAVIYNELAESTDTPAVAQRYTIRSLEQTSASLNSVARQPGDRPARSVLFDLINTATGHFRLGDIDPAVEAAHAALTMTDGVVSARAIDRLHTMGSTAAPYLRHPDVRAIRQDVQQLSLPVAAAPPP